SILGPYASLAQENLQALQALARARELKANGRFSEAIEAYTESLAYDANYARVYYGRADCRGNLGEPDANIDSDCGSMIRHRQYCELFRVQPGEKRTTPVPCVDILKVLPDLAECAATTVHLHARYGPEPPKDASKLGGLLLWPKSEPWPVCNEHHRMPYVGVL